MSAYLNAIHKSFFVNKTKSCFSIDYSYKSYRVRGIAYHR